MSAFRLGELFCGPGGMAYAAFTAKIANPEYRIIHQWATDYDKDTCDTYFHNIHKIFPDAEDSVICKDIQEIKRHNGKNLEK